VSDLELDACLRDRDLVRPFCSSEAGIRRLRKGPESEVLRPFQLVGENVVTFLALKAQAQGVSVEGPRPLSVSHDRSDARYKLDFHRPAPPALSLSALPSIHTLSVRHFLWT